MHGVLAEHERRRDLAVAHARRDEAQDLRLTRAERRGIVCYRAVAVQEAGERAKQLALVVTPREMRIAVQRDEPRMRQQRRQLAPSTDRHRAVAAAMKDERRDRHLRE